MTDTIQNQADTQGRVSAEQQSGVESASATRRALLGTGLSAALGISGAVAMAAVGGAAPAAAATASSSTRGTATAASNAITPKVTPRSKQGAAKLVANSGPADRDQSVAATTQGAAASVPIGKQYTTYAAAMAAAQPSTSSMFGASHYLHLLRRTTFGPRPSDISDLKRLGVSGWLAHQLAPSTLQDPEGAAVWKLFPLAGASAATISAKTAQFSWDAMIATAQATLGMQVFSRRQLFEVTADVMSAHLHVAVPGEQWNTSPGYIKNVIRKYAFGKYRDMLRAAMKHPAMLNFLSNDQSYKSHVNENLGRELLELHTVGVASGYTEDMVKASAAILSGRTINYSKGTYFYDKNRHETGAVTVLGFSDPNLVDGEAVGDRYLNYLATHPATAHTIARKLAVRFVADQPSEDLVARLAQVYLKNDTSIVAVVKAIFLSSDFWSSVGTRMRRPMEDTIGAARVLNVRRSIHPSHNVKGLADIYWRLWNQGNAPLGWNPPNGYPDVAAAWLGAGSMIDRWNGHRALVFGWGSNFKYETSLTLVKRTTRMTCEQWLDAMSKRLVGVVLSPAHKTAILTALSLTATDKIPMEDWRLWQLGEGVGLILDSAYFQLR